MYGLEKCLGLGLERLGLGLGLGPEIKGIGLVCLSVSDRNVSFTSPP